MESTQHTKPETSYRKSRSHQKRRRRKSRKTLHYMMLLILLVLIGVVLSLTVFFKIEDIKVDNIDYYTDEEVIAATGLELEGNLFLAKISDIPQHLKAEFPYIEEVSVRRTLPPAIEIDIYPSMPAAALQHGDEYALITSSGKVLERGLVLMPSTVILVNGVELADRQPGDYLGQYIPESSPKGASDEEIAEVHQRNLAGQLQAEQERDALAVISYLVDAIDKTGFEGITNLDLTNPLNMTIMYENRLLLKLGTELRLEYKLNYLKTAIALQHPKAHGILNAENSPTSGKVNFTPSPGYDIHGNPLTADEDDKKDEGLDDPEEPVEDPTTGDIPLSEPSPREQAVPSEETTTQQPPTPETPEAEPPAKESPLQQPPSLKEEETPSVTRKPLKKKGAETSPEKSQEKKPEKNPEEEIDG